jgi:hypothetical protein
MHRLIKMYKKGAAKLKTVIRAGLEQGLSSDQVFLEIKKAGIQISGHGLRHQIGLELLKRKGARL